MATFAQVEYECPLCGEKFSCLTQMSCYIFGTKLDFKPIGMAIIPTPVPKCPKCDLVFFNKLFTEDDINKLKEKLANNNIFKLEPDMPKYYYLAKEFELLDKEIDSIINYYHSAIWEIKNKYDLFVKITDIIMKYFEKTDISNKHYYDYIIIKLDFLRRRGEFEEAKHLITGIYSDENFPFSEENKILLEFQEELIDKNNIDEHTWPNKNKKEREIDTFISSLRISITVKEDTKNIIERLNKTTLLKSSKIFYKINNNLPLVTDTIYSGKICETIEYLKEDNVDTTLTIRTKTINKDIKLTELGDISFNIKNRDDLKNKLYTMFAS
jgi:hypothetical protein